MTFMYTIYKFERDATKIKRLLHADKEPIDERGVIDVAKLPAEGYFRLIYEQRQQKYRQLQKYKKPQNS